MKITRAYRLKLYPNQSQEQYFSRTASACRFIWNHYLDKQKNDYLNGIKSGYFDHTKDLTTLKQTEEYSWLKDTQVHFLQQSLRDLDKAYSAFFNKKVRYPNFKSKHTSKPSFRKPNGWKLIGSRIQLTRDIIVRTRGKLPLPDAKLTSITMSRDPSGTWYASIVATEEITPTVKTGDPIGIDLGLKHLAITSDGRKFEAMKPKKAQRKRMKTLQQSLCRKQKGSIRRARVKVDLARLHEKIKNRRANRLHKVSHQLASESQAVIVVEDLAVKNMMANHKLADVIADTGWGEFVRQLEYKQLWSGGTVEKIDRFFPSSKMCSSCSYIVGKLPLNIRVWQCPECSAEHDRDINAAKNLMKQWLGNSHAWRVRRVASSSDEVMVSGSMKRERIMMVTSSI